MTKINMKKELCPCPVCRSDVAYVLPCMRKAIPRDRTVKP